MLIKWNEDRWPVCSRPVPMPAMFAMATISRNIILTNLVLTPAGGV